MTALLAAVWLLLDNRGLTNVCRSVIICDQY